MKFLNKGSVLAIALVVASSESGAAKTGNEFLALVDTDPYAGLTFVMGVADGLDLAVGLLALASKTEPVKVRGCLPEGVTTGQLRDVAVKEIRDNPKDRHLDASVLLLRSWLGAWPCSAWQKAPLAK